MASEDKDQNVNNMDSPDDSNHDGLGGFISSQLKQQERESREKDNLDGQKREDFISRALAESKRMNAEIEKSKAKQDKLHTEFGKDLLNDWRNEHAAEVLTPKQQELIAQHH